MLHKNTLNYSTVRTFIFIILYIRMYEIKCSELVAWCLSTPVANLLKKRKERRGQGGNKVVYEICRSISHSLGKEGRGK